MTKCVICHLPLRKEETLVTLHYEVKYIEDERVIIANNVTVHLDCRFSEEGKEFLGLI